MTFPKTLATVFLAGALSLGGLSVLASAIGAPESLAGQSAWAGHHKAKAMCDRGKPGHHGHGWKHGKYGHGRKGPDQLAPRLAAMETEIGIRAEQLDAWRDYTDALQAVMKRPSRAGLMAGAKEPFSRVEGMADRMIERAEAAEKLKAAIATLRTTLTQEQLDKATAIGERFQARMAKIHGWKHGGKSCGAKQATPTQMAPEAQPDDGAEAVDDDDADPGEDT